MAAEELLVEYLHQWLRLIKFYTLAPVNIPPQATLEPIDLAPRDLLNNGGFSWRIF